MRNRPVWLFAAILGTTGCVDPPPPPAFGELVVISRPIPPSDPDAPLRGGREETLLGLTQLRARVERVEVIHRTDADDESTEQRLVLDDTPRDLVLLGGAANEEVDQLAFFNVPVGFIFQIRLVVSAMKMTIRGIEEDVTIPSGTQSGVKVNPVDEVPFPIIEGRRTVAAMLISAFDQLIANQGQGFIMKPTVPGELVDRFAPVTLCNTADPEADPDEHYRFAVLDSWLDDPQFQAFAGISPPITDCDTARSLVELHTQYLESFPPDETGPEMPAGLPLEDPGPLLPPDDPGYHGPLVVPRLISPAFVPGRRGPVLITTTDARGERGKACTGLILSRDWVLTAGHCVAKAIRNGADSATGQASVEMTHPDGTHYCLSGGFVGTCLQIPPIPDNRRAAILYLHPDYGGSGDQKDDVGLIYIAKLHPFDDVDRARIHAGAVTLDESVRIFGWGWTSTAGTCSKSFRFRTGTQRLDWVGDRHWRRAAHANEARICKGDSGGPAGYWDGFDITKGITSNVKGDPPGPSCCARTSGGAGNRDRQRFTRLGPKKDWVEAVTGLRCLFHQMATPEGSWFWKCEE